jgi:hypothetical protein
MTPTRPDISNDTALTDADLDTVSGGTVFHTFRFGSAKQPESSDRLGNFEIQNMMSQYNQAQSLASSVLKKRDNTNNSIINKI